MSNNTVQSFNKSNTKVSNSSQASTTGSTGDTMTRMHPSMKRPRAPIACYRCHHKKVRCDGVHPNCTRCLSTGVLCAYPSSRRSRNTQPTNVDPFIDNLSQLEARIRRIETDLESQRALVRSVCASDGTADIKGTNTLTSRMLKTEKDLQESRSIVAQLRLRGEQRAARGRRAAAAAAASAASSTPGPDKNNNTGKHSKDAAQPTAKRANHTKSRANNNKKEKLSTMVESSPIHNSTRTAHMMNDYTAPFYFNAANTNDFINPSPTYYFPSYPSTSSSAYTTDMMCPTSSSSTPFPTSVFSDWPLLNDLPSTSAPNPSSAATTETTAANTNANGFVDPMIIAAATEANQQYAPPILSVSSYMVDEESSIMAARARSLSHLPTTDANMLIPVLQPSSSSTSTSSNSSFGFGHHLYEGYTQFMDSNGMMMVDPTAATGQQSLR